MPGLKWYAIYSDQPDSTVEIEDPGDILGRFDIASQLHHLAHRKIKGMWIIRHGDTGDDVLRMHGSVPAEISERYYALKRRHD